MGSRVFIGENVVCRKLTVKAKRALRGLLAEIVEPLKDQRVARNATFQRYQAVALTDQLADHAMLDLYRQNAYWKAIEAALRAVLLASRAAV